MRVAVRSPVPVRRVVLVIDGVETKSFPGEGRRDFTATHDLGAMAAGRHWGYWRVETEGPNTESPDNLALAEGNLGWSTPIWFTQQ